MSANVRYVGKKIDNVSGRHLIPWNLIAGILHMIQAGILWTLTEGVKLDLLFIEYGFNVQEQEIEPVFKFWTEIPVSRLVVAFVFLSGLAHLLIAIPLRKRYLNHIRNNQNPYRWYEYSVTASIMIVVIGLLAGVWTTGTLLALFGLTSVMNLMGLVMEYVNDVSESYTQDVMWSPYWIGVIAGIIPWVVIGNTLWRSIAAEPDVPNWVIVSFVVIFFFFNIFALNQYLQYKQVSKWKDYVFGEKAYIFLSITSKSTLAWLVWYGLETAPL